MEQRIRIPSFIKNLREYPSTIPRVISLEKVKILDGCLQVSPVQHHGKAGELEVSDTEPFQISVTPEWFGSEPRDLDAEIYQVWVGLATSYRSEIWTAYCRLADQAAGGRLIFEVLDLNALWKTA